MTQKSSNPLPDYPRPRPSLPGVNKSHDGISNTEVYGALALILLELKEINARLDDVCPEKAEQAATSIKIGAWSN